MSLKNNLLNTFVSFGMVAEKASRTWDLHENGTF